MKKFEINSKKHGLHEVLVDDKDFECLNNWKWSIYKAEDNLFYAVRREGRRIIRMHRQIMGANITTQIVDHKDRNGLNNQRHNLRMATESQSQANRRSHTGVSSKYLGVSFDKNRNKWQVQICKDKVKKSLGRYSNEADAALAYNNAAKVIHGEFANLNLV